jgi:hypothetical protein
MDAETVISMLIFNATVITLFQGWVPKIPQRATKRENDES